MKRKLLGALAALAVTTGSLLFTSGVSEAASDTWCVKSVNTHYASVYCGGRKVRTHKYRLVATCAPYVLFYGYTIQNGRWAKNGSYSTIDCGNMWYPTGLSVEWKKK